MKVPALSLIILTSAACIISSKLTIAATEQLPPVFELFDPAPALPTKTITWDPKQSLLSISKIKSFHLDPESGDVQLTFTDLDAKKLAQITEERAGKLLIVVSDGEAVVVFRLRAPIVDGVMQIYRAAGHPNFDAFLERLKKRQQ